MALPQSSQTSPLKISSQTELIGVSLHLRSPENFTLYPQYTTALHAWFLDQVRQQDPILSSILHDQQDEKAFTISGINSSGQLVGGQIQLSVGKVYTWHLNLFSQPVVNWLREWLKNPPFTLNIRQHNLDITGIYLSLPATTYEALYSPPDSHSLTLSFLSPTSFRRKGYHFPLPLPINVFQSYLRRWNSFSGKLFDAEGFLAWVDENVLITRHQLNSVKVSAGKKGVVTGFMGAIEYTVTREGSKNQDYTQALFSLARFAPYCGTGHKTTFGLGETHLGWLLEQDYQEAPLAGINLAERVENLTEQLLSLQKRPKGERALRSCQLKALITARREAGESLIEIAEDLQMPYETVKTYVKLVRRLLKK
jgi:CRISPR-associated endoribonuclease Cas6